MVYSSAVADRVRGSLSDQSRLSEKEMFGGIAFLVGGNMAVGVLGEDLLVRVDPRQTSALLREPGAKPFDMGGGRVPTGWLLVAPLGFRTDAALRAWVSRGVAYASSLPMKVAKKGKARRK